MKIPIFSLITVFSILAILIAFLASVVFGDTCTSLSCGSVPMPSMVKGEHITWTQEMENERLAKLMVVKQVKKVTPAVKKIIEQKKGDFDIYRLANAVAIAETGNCTKGYGKTYNNCFGIKNGNTAPCPKIGRNRMCIYEKPQDSYDAFVKIWSKWYKGFPTLSQARTWSGNDSASTWLKHVKIEYNK